MTETRFIQVILPLKLEWEPYYRLEEGMEVCPGSRVQVLFAGSFYVACVSAVEVSPTIGPEKIMPVQAVLEDIPAVSEPEIRFWRILAHYYLCTVGEVYKAAYPREKNHGSRLKLPAMEVPEDNLSFGPEQEKAADAVRKGLDGGKPVLLHGGPASGKTDICLKMALETLRTGRSVLYLVPDISLLSSMEEAVGKVFPSLLVYHSGLTPGKRKRVAQVLRTGKPCVVLGTRSALFLPHHALGLVIVDQEHSPAYKQDAPAPRYHARESAIMLAGVHGAQVILSSATPSLESIYNAQCGRFIQVNLNEGFHSAEGTRTEIINTVAESRKKGMSGHFSFKLIAGMRECLDGGKQVLLLGPRRPFADGKKLLDEVMELFPSARIGTLEEETEPEGFDILLGSTLLTGAYQSRNLGLVALLAADGMLSRQDFRADERALQVLEQLKGRCPLFVIQTREPHHPVFSLLALGGDPTARLLEERRITGLPPYTRLLKVFLKDTNEKRVFYLAQELAGVLCTAVCPPQGPLPAFSPVPGEFVQEIRLLLPRDKALAARKQALLKTVWAFEQQRKYTGHIGIDVDPV